MSQHNIDRIDLQHKRDSSVKRNIINYNNNINLIEHKNPNQYNYNVNPSIYRFNKFKDIMFNFNYSYRDIECSNVQNYCIDNLKIYTLHSNNPIVSCYFSITDIFLFLHITHTGKLAPKDIKMLKPSGPKFVNDMIHNEYKKIIEKYNLGSKREFHAHW
jgi:hypothetical protein